MGLLVVSDLDHSRFRLAEVLEGSALQGRFRDVGVQWFTPQTLNPKP